MFDFTQLSKSTYYLNSLKKNPFTQENLSLLKEEQVLSSSGIAESFIQVICDRYYYFFAFCSSPNLLLN